MIERNSRRTTVLTAAAVTALFTLTACTFSSHKATPTGPISTQKGPTATPATTFAVTLTLTAPGFTAGGTITAPTKVSYALTGSGVAPLDIQASSGYKLRLELGERGASPTTLLDLPIAAASGTVTIPANPMYSGIRDVTFVLVTPTGVALTSRTVRHVTIDGPK